MRFLYYRAVKSYFSKIIHWLPMNCGNGNKKVFIMRLLIIVFLGRLYIS